MTAKPDSRTQRAQKQQKTQKNSRKDGKNAVRCSILFLSFLRPLRILCVLCVRLLGFLAAGDRRRPQALAHRPAYGAGRPYSAVNDALPIVLALIMKAASAAVASGGSSSRSLSACTVNT